jgi:RluA family pseudouridine synthase
MKHHILFEDTDLIVVDKPVGLAAIPERTPDAPSLVAQLEEYCKQKLFVVHRLDKETSGAIIFAKGMATHRDLNMQFEKKIVRKTYLALLHKVLVPDKGSIDRPLRQFGSGRMGMDFKNGKKSITEFTVRERFTAHTLVDAHPLTGRRHQLRVHFYSIGHPIAGDPLYGDTTAPRAFPRMMLHAAEITFRLMSGREQKVIAPVPAEFTQVLESLAGRMAAV